MFLSRHLKTLPIFHELRTLPKYNHLPKQYIQFLPSKPLFMPIKRNFCLNTTRQASPYDRLRSNRYYNEVQPLIEQHGSESLEVVEFIENKSFELYKQGKFDDALQFATAAKDIYQDIKMSASEYSLLTLISDIHVKLKNYEQAIEALSELIDLKQRVQGGHNLNLANLHSKLASLYFHQGRYEESLQCYRQAVDLVEKEKPDEAEKFLNLYYSAGLSAFNAANYKESNSLALKALNYAEKSQDQKLIYRCCHLLGLLREEENNPEDGVFYFKKALFAGEAAFNPQSYEIALINYLIGKGEFRLERIDQAVKYTYTALSLFNQAKDKNPLDIADARYNLGLMYFKLKQVDAALENLDKALEEFMKFGDQYEVKIALVLENKGLILQELGRKEEAVSAFNKVISICDKYKDSQNLQIAKIYENIAKIYVEFYQDKLHDAKVYARKAFQIASQQKDSPVYKEAEALIAYLDKNGCQCC